MKVTKTSRPAYEAPDTLVVKVRVEHCVCNPSNTLQDMGYNEVFDEDFE